MLGTKGVGLTVALLCCAGLAFGDPAPRARSEPAQKASSDPALLLGPPKQAGPVAVEARFELRDILEIDDAKETFQFYAVLTLTWNDPRQAFDPGAAGLAEKVFQGSYQFNEVSTGWYPQVVLANESGLYEKSGVVLRVKPDGTSTLTETLTATAEVDLDLRLFPLDSHHLLAVFEVLGFDRDEIVMEIDPAHARALPGRGIRVPEWRITDAGLSIPDGSGSSFVVSVDVERDPFYFIRLVVLPLMAIVFLSFSVFWMDRSSLGDRINVSFIGILTGVAYQLVISDSMPHLSYFTLMHGFLSLSFATMCATVVINLVVGTADKRNEYEFGDRIDQRCRWLFPLAYLGLNFVMVGGAFLFFHGGA